MTVCDAVRQLLYDCGNELGWCFTEDQVQLCHLKLRACNYILIIIQGL